MIIAIMWDDWISHWRTEIFALQTFKKYPNELIKLMSIVKKAAKDFSLNPYELMYVFEVFWSIYFGPIMPWKARCSHCIAFYTGLCLGGVKPAKCILHKAIKETIRIAETKSRDILVKIEPAIPLQILRITCNEVYAPT